MRKTIKSIIIDLRITGLFQVLFSSVILLRCANLLNGIILTVGNGADIIMYPIPYEIYFAPSRHEILYIFTATIFVLHIALLILGENLYNTNYYINKQLLSSTKLIKIVVYANIFFILLCFLITAIMFNIYVSLPFDILNIFSIIPATTIIAKLFISLQHMYGDCHE